jgi:hypothetical protein
MIAEIISQKEAQLQEQGFLEFSQEELSNFDQEIVKHIKEHFRGYAMMMLPESELEFFEWLKREDRAVWDDLWKDEENPYNVSIDFLHHFLEDGNGFPICDLIEEENYWFTAKHIKPKGLEQFDTINEKIDNNQRFTFEEALLFEIIQHSIDIWHFCYRYKMPIHIAKQKITKMKSDELLVHLTKREDLVKYLDV